MKNNYIMLKSLVKVRITNRITTPTMLVMVDLLKKKIVWSRNHD